MNQCLKKAGVVLRESCDADIAKELEKCLQAPEFRFSRSCETIWNAELTPLLKKAHPKKYTHWYQSNDEARRIWKGMRRKHKLLFMLRRVYSRPEPIEINFEYFEWTPDADSFVGACAFCAALMKKRLICSRCKDVAYCSRTCQKKDWANHKAKCGQQPPSPNSVTQVDVRVDAAMRNVGDQLVAGMRHALANAGVAETRSRVFGPVRLPM